MKGPIGIPLIARKVHVVGPRAGVAVDLVFDTGAAYTVLSWSILMLIGYDPATVSGRQEVVTANGVIHVPKLIIKEMAWGDVSAKNVEVICHDIPEMVEVRGLLGLSFLRHFRTTIDYREGYIEMV